MTIVYRFARDLRLDDHAGLNAAAADGDILPLLVIDEPLAKRLRSSPRRAAFFCGAVAALDAALRERSVGLVVRRGAAIDVLGEIKRAVGVSKVTWSASYDAEGKAQDAKLKDALAGAELHSTIVHDAPAIPPEETTEAHSAGGDGYRAFVPYYEVWRELTPGSYEAPLLLSFARTDLQSEPLPQPDEFGANGPAALCSTADSRRKLDAFLRGPALQYSVALNVPSDDRTSHLSADLTFGTIAARTIVRETRLRLDDPFLLSEERASLRLFLRSVAMRDFFLQLAWYHPQTAREPLQEKMRDFPFAQAHAGLDAWREGRTGYPLVDAGMRQLRATGWMHPRVRALAASFLCFDLGMDWRAGMAEWDRYLIEDDPALAVGNWQWIAGVGADLAAYPRIYNPRKQARRFDPAGTYARTWIAELANAPGSTQTARVPPAQIALPLHHVDPYPQPVVDHDVVARAFLERYQNFFTRAADRPTSR